jgi:hypothetical protein
MNILNQPSINAKDTYLGFASIQFRNKTLDTINKPNWIRGTYVLNIKGDGWFRGEDGISKDYGLCITHIEITGRNYFNMSQGKAIKAQIEYLNFSEKHDKADIWLFIHNDTTIEEVIAYINDNKKHWVP